MDEADRLVRGYLRRLRWAARGLPRPRREELLAEIAEHIAHARREGAGDDPGLVRVTLARLGSPRDIARAADAGGTIGRPGGQEIAAVVLLLGGVFLVLVGWVVGCVLLWASPRWRWSDKLLGTLVWPGGLGFPLALGTMQTDTTACVGPPTPAGTPAPPEDLTCVSSGPPLWAAITVAVALFVLPAVVAVRLLRRARRVPEQQARATRPG